MHKYIYPPRIESKLPVSSLDSFDNMNKFMGQVKLNGSSMGLYTNSTEIATFNRHKERMQCKLDSAELMNLNPYNDWMVVVGEYMNKNKKDEDGKPWNLKYVIFDILVLDGQHLLKTTFEERANILKDIYVDNPTKKHMHQISENCYRVDSFNTDFSKVYDDITSYDMYEGLCLKKRTGKLENGTTVNNNTGTQFKVRKPTKNYNF